MKNLHEYQYFLKHSGGFFVYYGMGLIYIAILISAIAITYFATKAIYQVKPIDNTPSIYEQNFNANKEARIKILQDQLDKIEKLGVKLKKAGERIDILKV